MALSRKQQLENRANQPNKFNVRRNEIAAATLEALAENGYAKTSLRDIAAKAGFSLGTLHYYFENKVELISFCVRKYKRKFIDDLKEVTEGAATYEALTNDFCNLFIYAIEFDSNAHRLWYDTRSQSMFDPNFRGIVKEVEDSYVHIASHLSQRIEHFTGTPMGLSNKHIYWLLDGMFYHYLQLKLDKGENSAADFNNEMQAFFASYKD